MATKSKKKPAAPKKKPASKKPAPRKPAAKAKAARKTAAPMATAPTAPAVDEETIQILAATRADIVRLSEELQAALSDRDRLRGEVTVVSDRHRLQSAELDKLRGETLRGAADIAEATRRADEAGRRADEREHERLRVMRELEATHAQLAGYKLRCPKCGKNFVEEEYEGITIDRCTGCDAVYFDAGEVDQLIARVHEKTTAPSADPQQTSGWFRSLFKRKAKPGEPTGGEPPPVA
ncbi:MAG TPA: zf-TFIIB domain-containing protein [Polyangia bacterium]|nr:zf-TFIIB domain-containing protein [Polyangia bacterium]